MNLTNEMLDEITDSVTVVGRDEPRAQDRRQPRVKLSTYVAVQPLSDPTSKFSVRIRDISVGGIGLFHSERILLDEQLVIRLPLKDEKTLLVSGTVVYWEPLAEKLFGIGVQFERIVNEAEINDQTRRAVRQQISQAGVMSRMTQAFARTWRIAS
jgi:Tfp pilus assembly protein PilZ